MFRNKKLLVKFVRVVECTTTEGTGHNHLWHMNMAEQTSSIFKSKSSYSPPSIAQYQPNPGVATEASTLGWTIHQIKETKTHVLYYHRKIQMEELDILVCMMVMEHMVTKFQNLYVTLCQN